ncbi:MAG: HDIG domain-containing protein, partial [Anaerolineaceae bacterium]|nr:HDIG domain-containing protein [Anaerolineaceae bacterium]
MLINKLGRFFGKSKFTIILSVLLIAIAIFLALILPVSLRSEPSLLKIGDVAFQDIRAPRSFNYVSEILTETTRKEAEKSVSPIYLPADPVISRTQIEKLKNIVGFINSIRSDTFASEDQKSKDLSSLSEITFSNNTTKALLELTDESWDIVRSESLFLLEDVMKSSIREDQVTSIRRNLPPRIGFEVNDLEAGIINELVSPLIRANSVFSNENTARAIEEARSMVDPITKHYISGEIIVNSGKVIDPLTWEALQELGFTEPKNRITDYISACLLVITVMGFNILFIQRVKRSFGKVIEGLPVIVITFLIFLFSARFIIPNHAILPYLFPIAAFGVTIASLYNYEAGLIFSISLSLLAAFNQGYRIDLAVYYFIPSAVAIFILGRGRRITIFFLAGLGIAISGSLLVISYRMQNSFLDASGASTLIGAAFVNGFGAISLALIFQYVLAQLLGKTTALQLMDLSRPDHPLLQELLLNAPGTYQHSLQVANLAEQAAKEINADALLTRIGALYHDIGKSQNPNFFIENQLPSQIDTHENIDPLVASATIIQHVEDGIMLGRKYHLPPQILAFINEHHGSSITRYQYEQALEKSSDSATVNKELFKYPGKKPNSKETALLMLADGCEARVKAESPKNPEDIEKIISENIKAALNQGQLDQCNLTLNDLRVISKSFTRTLQNTYHHRIIYPKLDISEQG